MATAVQFNEGRPSHMRTGMLTKLSLFALCSVARCMQLIQMCFHSRAKHEADAKLVDAFLKLVLCRILKSKVLRKRPPKAQPPRRGTLCLVSLGCSHTIRVCIHVSISSVFISTSTNLTGGLFDF